MGEKHLVGVVDNAKNITKAWNLMERKVLNCIADTMNLAVKRALAGDKEESIIGKVLTKARNL